MVWGCRKRREGEGEAVQGHGERVMGFNGRVTF